MLYPKTGQNSHGAPTDIGELPYNRPQCEAELHRSSRDTVLNAESYAKNRANLPANTTELVIEGGNNSFTVWYAKKKSGCILGNETEHKKVVAERF